MLLADIDLDAAIRVAASCGSGAQALALDITSDQEWVDALTDARERLGGLDILVNNAAIVHPGDSLKVEIAAHRATIDVNAIGPMVGILTALPAFQEQGHGHIVTVCSMTAFLPFPGLTSYAAAKHALRAFHLGVAAERRRSPVKFTIVHPGATETPMLDREAESDDVAFAFTSDPISPETVAAAILAAIDAGAVEAFVPAERAEAVKALGGDPEALFSVLDEGEAEGRRRLEVRRELMRA